MASILELPEVRQRVSPLTVEDYHRLAGHLTTAELVVEVAVTSPALDRENATLYAEAGVKAYWIVLGAARRVEIYRRPENGRYQDTSSCGVDAVLACAAVPGVQVPVANLFA